MCIDTTRVNGGEVITTVANGIPPVDDLGRFPDLTAKGLSASPCIGPESRGIQDGRAEAPGRVARAAVSTGGEGRRTMTYCLGITTKDGFVVASDSRSNAGYDQVNLCRKMHTFVMPGDRVFAALTSGSLSCSQSIVTLLRRDFERGEGLAAAESMYDAARVVGEQVRRVAEVDRKALERDDFKFNVHFLLAGQIRGSPHDLYMIYPQGNPLRAAEESPFLQIGECKYGRPILDRGVRFDRTSLEDAARYALISLDSTMRSNVTVGPPIDLIVYSRDELKFTRQRRFPDRDPDLVAIQSHWEHALRQAVQTLPSVRFDTPS
jgi:putative proteasome-type protease